MGGFVTFTYEYQSNQRESKLAIAGKVSVETAMSAANVQLEASYENEAKSKGVNIRKYARTNTKLTPACADAVMGDDFKVEQTRDCITEW